MPQYCYTSAPMASTRRTVRYSTIAVITSVCLLVAVFTYGLHEKVLNTLPVIRNSPLLTEPLKMWPQCREYSNDSVAPAQVLSKELVVRRVYFDPRKRDGYANAAVFIMEAKGLTLNGKRFSGCQIGRFYSDRFHFRPPFNYKWAQVHKHATSTLALIDCYNIPKVENGDMASLCYKSSEGIVVKVQSQKSLFVSEPRAVTTSSTVTAVVCIGVVFSGKHSPAERGMIYHWLRYQKVIGMDHVHMYVEDSFVRAGGLENEAMQQAIKEGFLSIDFWPLWLNATEVFITQHIAYQDCLYHFQGVYDYIIYCDSDDFFVPLKSKSVKYYLQKWCTGKVASCNFRWYQFFPDCGWDPNAIGNFTAAMTYKHVWKRQETKSAHQLKALVDGGTHMTMALLKGYSQRGVPSSEAYFSHIRFGKIPDKGC